MITISKGVIKIGRNDPNKLVPLFTKHYKEKRLIGFDIETHGKTNTFYMGGLYFPDGTYKSFYSKEAFIREFLKKKYYTNTYMVATNLGFDLTGLFYGLKEWNSLDIIMSGGRMISGSLLAKNRQRLTFIDSFNHAPFSVAQMGDMLKLPKLKSPVALGKIPSSLLERTELEVYNKRDCEVTQKFTERLQQGYKQAGGKIKLTIASTSLEIFRRKYLRKVLYKERVVLGFDPKYLIYESYFGGRTEAFQRGSIFSKQDCKKKGIPFEKYRMYDINSLYPSVMINEYPDPNFPRYQKTGKISIIEKYEGITRVKMFCPPMKYPLLPMRIDNKLIFATGIINGMYTHVEIRKALSLGYRLDHIGETLYYKKTFLPFKEFIIDMYNKRKELKAKGDPNEIVYKLIMNSAYGKFGAKHLSETIFFNKEFLDDEGINAVRNNPNVIMKDDNNGMIINNKECDESYVFPIFASYTTAYARIKLHDYLVMSNAIYSDTDCVITKELIPESKELGAMKLEHDILEACIVKPKMYYLKALVNGEEKEILKLKGVPKRLLYKDEQVMLDKNIFYEILKGESVHYNKFTKLKEGVRRGIMPNTIIEMEKFIQVTDDKRDWEKPFSIEYLGDSIPFEMEEEKKENNEELIKCITTTV